MALRAVSTASAPLFMSRALSKPVSLQSFSNSGGNWSLRNARLVRARVLIWAIMASAILGWLWPWFTAE